MVAPFLPVPQSLSLVDYVAALVEQELGGFGGSLPSGADVGAATLAATGGHVVLPGQYNLPVPLVIPLRTTLSGVDGNPSQPLLGEAVTARQSLLISTQTAQAAVQLNGRGSCMERLTLAYGGLAAPPTTPVGARAMVASFAGTGVAVSEADCSLSDMMIAGWQLGVSVVPSSAPGATSRFRVRNVRMDTINGIFCSNQFDVAYIADVEMWPFLATDITGLVATDYVRDGYGLYLQGGFDSGKVENVFCFGKTQSFVLDDVRGVTMNNCLADSADGTTPNNPTALTLMNSVWGIRLYDFACESQHLGLQLDTTYTDYPNNPTATFIGGRMNSNGMVANIQRGNYQFIGCTFGNSGGFPAINITAQATGSLSFVLPIFESSVTVPFMVDPAFTGHLDIVLAPGMGPEPAITGSVFPQALIDNGQITITMADSRSLEMDISPRPELQVGSQPRQSMFNNSGPSNQRYVSPTLGQDGAYRVQLFADDGVSGRGDMLRLYSNASGVSGFGTAVLPQYANDAAAKAATPPLVVGDWYWNGSANVQIRS